VREERRRFPSAVEEGGTDLAQEPHGGGWGPAGSDEWGWRRGSPWADGGVADDG